MKTKLFSLSLFILLGTKALCQITEPIVLGYFPSWSEDWVSANQDSKLRRIPSFVTHVFLSFAKPDLTYVQGSYDISQTGINVPYDGCALKESVSALNDKGIKVILSLGGETYWGSSTVYANINYQAIKDLVDDMGFAGIDWDYEPNGSFGEIGNATNVQHFIDFINNSRALMPSNQGYIIACAPSGVGALGGQSNDDANSPFKFASRNSLTGETDANLYNGAATTNGINLFGFSSTGHMIPVIQAVGDKIDIIAFQGYNCGGSTNRAIMYDSYAYYAEIKGFKVAAGVHYPNEPWGPYYNYNHSNVAALSQHIKTYPSRIGDNDGIMIWQLLMAGASSSAYSYMHVASEVLNGATESAAVSNATNYSLQPYTGGAQGCEGGSGGTTYCGYSAYNSATTYATAGTRVYHNCKIWQNQWWANPGEEPGVNGVWAQVSNCSEGPGCNCVGVPTYSTITTSSCSNYTSPGGSVYSSSGVYYDTLTNADGCDSIITINLTINSFQAFVSEANDVLSASVNNASYQWLNCATNQPIAGQTNQTFTPNSNGNYAVIVTSNGCSDTSDCHQFSLCSGGNSSSSATVTACNAYQSPGGFIYTVSGTYLDTIPNASGCDSVITTNLTIQTLQSIISLNGTELVSSTIGDTYQWMNCNGNTAIQGANAQSYSPSATGDYALVVSANNCTDTSDCLHFVWVGLNEQDLQSPVKWYPNPVSSNLSIDLGIQASSLCVNVYSFSGQLVQGFQFEHVQVVELPLSVQSGSYLVTIDCPELGKIMQRIVKNE